MNISQKSIRPVSLRKSKLSAKLWPNGELSIYFHHDQIEAAGRANVIAPLTKLRDTMVRTGGVFGAVLVLVRLGLSHPRNFDRNYKSQTRKGLKGITSLGKRRVRNAAYMLTRENGKHRLTFATVTLPNLTGAQMSRVHKAWHECINFYRREVGRVLRGAGLTGEIVGVSEVQEKRYAKTSLPVLHAHFVFCGAARHSGWALSPSRHDYIWRKSIEHVLGESIRELSSACQLKSVTASAEAYLGKYISKGAKATASVVRQGWSEWLPRQWWNCSRSLVQRMEDAIARFDNGAGWLVNRGADPSSDLFAFFSPVEATLANEDVVCMGYFGRLTPKANQLVRKVLKISTDKQAAKRPAL